jgi:hypothetical protein
LGQREGQRTARASSAVIGTGWGAPKSYTSETIDQSGNAVAKTPAAASDADRKVRVTWAGEGERGD